MGSSESNMYLYIDTVGIAWRHDWEMDAVCMSRLSVWNWNKQTHKMLLKWYGIAGKEGAKVFHYDHHDGDRYLKVNSHCTLS